MGNKPWSSYFEKGKFVAAIPGAQYENPKKFTLKVNHPEAEVKFRPAKIIPHKKAKNTQSYEHMPEIIHK